MHNDSVRTGHLIVSDSDKKYRVIQRLGSGGNCDVFLVVSLSAEYRGALFALKLFMKTDNPERWRQFLAEVELLKNIEHPSVLHVYDSGETALPTRAGKSTHPYVVADYYPETLDRAMSRGMRIPAKVLCMVQLLAALHHLASMRPPVVHRDIKPRNIFLRGHTCALGDFGLMRQVDDTMEDAAVILEKLSGGPGMPRGYRTPDLVRYAKGEAPLTVSSDLFQLGLVAAELFAGHNPMKPAKNTLAPIEISPIRNISGRHGATFLNLIERMLVQDPERRESVEELLDSWEGILNAVSHDYQHLEGRAF